jgi:Ca2+-dependent lipid-binding protein
MCTYLTFIFFSKLKKRYQKPQWHDQFRFNLSNEDKLDIELWESDANAQDNLVGSGQLLIAPFLQGGKFKQQKCKLKYNGAEGAEVFMDIEC